MFNTNTDDEMRSSFGKVNFVSRAIHLPTNFKPGKNDVVCGRGNAYCHLPSNILFTAIIRSNIKKYNDTPARTERSTVVTVVLDQILARGLRFVKKDRKTKKWYELSREQAHEKVGHALRDSISRFMKDENVESNRLSASRKSNKRQISQAKIVAQEFPSDLSDQTPRFHLNSFADLSNKAMESMECYIETVEPVPLHHIFSEGTNLDKWNITPLSLTESQDDSSGEADCTIRREDYIKVLLILSLDE
ncbi:hypothetical protein IV203_020860 [Nitzschia inconspicua]|uniref:DUF6824 domain-containing protein n=1 Tax=Nitzschia inconspicua TaxID=303405 RepID=A0A9K3KGT5_9STRA|nr:hypothetical protein IV203_020860 [Nitzschia inconspicua]